MYRSIFTLILVLTLLPTAGAAVPDAPALWSIQSAVGGRDHADDATLGKISGLTTGHLDDDEMIDLVVGHWADDQGELVIYQGNPEIKLSSRELMSRDRNGLSEPLPFHTSTTRVDLPFAPEWIEVGDVDGDGYQDVIVAARGRAEILWFPGDGRSNLGAARRLSLPGMATAWASGEIGVEDGVIDIAVAVTTDDGPRLIVFGSHHGSLDAQPAAYTVSEPLTAIAIGRLDGDDTFDLAVASGQEMLIFAWGPKGLTQNPEHIPFEAPVHDLAIGRFLTTSYRQLAVVLSNGLVSIIEMADGQWQTRIAGSCEAPLGTPGQGLIAARTAYRGLHNLVITDPVRGELTVLGISATKGGASLHEVSRLAVDAQAVFPVRLNRDALDDLLILPSDGVVPAVLLTKTFVALNVTSSDDTNDGTCNPSHCSLREAIIEANTYGAVTIIFDSGIQLIQPLTELPALEQAGMVIDGTNGVPPFTSRVRLDGSQCSVLCSGLTLTGGTATVSKLTVYGFNYNGIYVASDGNVIQDSIIGIDPVGAVSGNSNGILVFDGSDNTIGGTGAGEGNTIGLNNTGVYVFKSSSTPTSNLIYGNEIGSTGNLSAANGIGVYTYQALGTRIGTTGSPNIIANNNTGVLLSESSSDRVTANSIGINSSGAGAGNTGAGVKISSSPNCWVNAANTIANNGSAGIAILGAASTSVLLTNNSIYDNGGLAIDLSPTAAADGVTNNDPNDSDTGPNNLQNFPVITSADPDTGNIAISLESTVNSLFDIYYFSSPSCDPSGYGEAKTHLGSALAFTDPSGHYSGVVTFTLTTGQFVTALAIDSNNNSSEMSACVEVVTSAAALIFSDGFETGNTTGWSSTVG